MLKTEGMSSNGKREQGGLHTGEVVGGASLLSGGEWNLTKATPYAMFYKKNTCRFIQVLKGHGGSVVELLPHS